MPVINEDESSSESRSQYCITYGDHFAESSEEEKASSHSFRINMRKITDLNKYFNCENAEEEKSEIEETFQSLEDVNANQNSNEDDSESVDGNESVKNSETGEHDDMNANKV